MSLSLRPTALALALLFAAPPLCAAAEGDEADSAAARAVAWLASAVEDPSWSEVDATQANLGAKRLVVEAMLAYTLLLRPDLGQFDDLRARLHGRVSAAANGRSAATAFAFQNWGAGLSSVYVLEKAFRGEVDRAALRALADGFAERQNAEGGWGHGADLPIGFYPTTLIVTTYWALLALGGAALHGVKPDEVVLADALELLRAVQVESGGFPYGGRSYRKGVEAGRTAGVVLALASLGLEQEDTFRRAARYALRNVRSIPDGHASPAMHVFSGAMAMFLLGDEAWSAYSREVLARVLRAQRPDGSFDDVVPGSPDSLRLMGDESTLRAYITAFYAAALSTPRSRTAAALRLKKPLSGDEEAPAATSAALLRWRVSLPGVERVALDAERAVVLDARGTLHVLEAGTGQQLYTIEEGVSRPAAARLALLADRVLVWTEPALDDSLPESLRGVVEAGAAEPAATETDLLTCFTLEPAARAWQVDLAEPMLALRAGEHGLHQLTRSGRLHVRNQEDGAATRVHHVPALLVNNDLALLPGGAFAVADESLLRVYDGEGEETWKRRSRAPRGVVPAAVTSLSVWGDSLFAGSSDGSVARRDAGDGALVWQHALRSGVVRLAATGEDRVAVLCHDGQVHSVGGGELLWSRDIGRGRESPERSGLVRDGDLVWVDAWGAGRLVALEAATGEERASFPLAGVRCFAAGGGRVLIADGEGVCCHDAP